MPRIRKASAKEPSAEEVLATLGVDPELDPEDAAQEFTSRQASETVTDSEDDDSDDEGGRVVQMKPRAPRKPKPQAAPAPEPVAEEEESGFTDPLPYVPMPAPVPVKPRIRPNSPSVGRLGKNLASLVPGAEVIKIHKRTENGKLGYVGTYAAADFQGCKDLEDFLYQHVKPKWGYGEYAATGRDAQNREMNVGSVVLLGPPSEGGGGGGLSEVSSLVQTVLNQQQDMYREAREQLKGSEMNPVTVLKDVMQVSRMATEDARQEQQRSVSAGAESSNMMMQMFIQQMQANQQQMTNMMQMFMAPKEDSEVKQLLKKLVEKSSSDAIPPPPPPPPQDPMEGFAKLITALTGVLAPVFQNMGGGGGGADEEYKNLFKEMLAARESERFTPKEMLGLMQEMRQERGTDDFKKSADNIAMLLTLTNQMRQSTEGGASAGIWDALASLFGNRDFAGSIAQRIRSRASEQQTSMQVHDQQKMLAEQRALLLHQQNQERQRMAAQAQAALNQSQVSHISAQPPQPVAQPQAAAPQPASPPPSQQLMQVPQLPPLPANATDYINEITAAKDEASLIEQTMRLMMYLGEFEDWRPFVVEILTAAQSGNKRETMQYLAVLFEGFRTIGIIDLPLAKKVLIAVGKNFDMIHSVVGDDGSGQSIIPEDDEPSFDYLGTFEEEQEEEPEDEDEGA